jgi:hypothetical protein
VTDAFHGQAEIGEVAVVEARLRIVPLQVGQRRRIDEQPDRQLAVGLAQQSCSRGARAGCKRSRAPSSMTNASMARRVSTR